MEPCHNGGMGNAPFVIVGGGICGLAAALALPRQPVLLLEQAPAFEEVGAGLQIGPNAVRALQALGAWQAVEEIALSPPEIHIRNGITGALLKRIRLGSEFESRFGAPYRVAHRADLHKALLACVQHHPHVDLRQASAVAGVRQAEGNLHLALASGEALPASAVIGADGVKSVLRQQLVPQSAAVDSGHVLYRALLGDVPEADAIAMDCVNLWMFPRGHVVHYPVSHPARLNMVLVLEGSATPQHVISNLCAPLAGLLHQAAQWLPWPGLYVAPFAPWNHGRVLLLGDAAHATLPYLAQGGAMALEDAAMLKQAMTSTTDVEAAFAAVSQRRTARATRLLRQSLATGNTYHLSGLPAAARDMALRAMPPALFFQPLRWIYAGG